MATLRKCAPLQSEARIRKRGYPTTCKTFDTKAEAEAWAKDVETNMNKHLFVSAREAEQYTLGECLDSCSEVAAAHRSGGPCRLRWLSDLRGSAGPPVVT